MSGKVYFVGAGPGAADLLTVRAARLLGIADVVLHDGLVSREVLALVGPDAQIVDVGKRCGNGGLTQASLNRLLVTATKEHACVVRLKSGDPTVFGRLGEEMDALRERGISFEIVPGVTAALAAAAAATVSLTDRRHASELVLTTASRAGGERRECRGLARGETVVIYMPGPDYRRLSLELMASGAPFDTPCAIVSRAGSAEEAVTYTVVGRLATENPAAPAIVIVGEVARDKASVIAWQGHTHHAAASVETFVSPGEPA